MFAKKVRLDKYSCVCSLLCGCCDGEEGSKGEEQQDGRVDPKGDLEEGSVEAAGDQEETAGGHPDN